MSSIEHHSQFSPEYSWIIDGYNNVESVEIARRDIVINDEIAVTQAYVATFGLRSGRSLDASFATLEERNEFLSTYGYSALT